MMFRRLMTLVVLAAGLLVTAPTVGSAAASPAAAAGSAWGWTSGRSGVLWSDCRDHPFRYGVGVPGGAQGWSLDVTAYGPDGTYGGSDYFYDGSDPMSGTGHVFLCGGLDRPGRYTLRAKLEWYDANWNSYTKWLRPSSFSLRSPRTRTTLTVSDRSPRRGQIVRFGIGSRGERPRGYFANEYADVRLQRLVGGRWTHLRGSRTWTDWRGRTTLMLRADGPRRGAWVRAVTDATAEYSSSASRRVWVLRAG